MHRFTQLLSLLILLSATSLHAQIPTLSGSKLSIEDLETQLSQRMDELNMAGLSLLVFNKKKVLYSTYRGFEHAVKRTPVSESTVFEAASMTKPVFSFLVMRLVEQGLIDLDRPLASYFLYPDLQHDERHKQITARMVLTHQTGLPNWRYYGGPLEFQFDPGTGFQYSGEGFVYLGKTIENLLQKDLETIFQEYVFRPLEMESSTVVWSPAVSLHKAQGHYHGDIPSPDMYRPLEANPAASLLTTVQDYYRFILAVQQRELLSEASYEEMLKVQVKPEEESSHQNESNTINWGLAWVLEESPFGWKYQHGGNNGDFECYFEIAESGLGYVYFSNSDQGDELNKYLQPLLNEGKILEAEPGLLSDADQIALNSDSWTIYGDFVEMEYLGTPAIAMSSAGQLVLDKASYKNFVVEFDAIFQDLEHNLGLMFRSQGDTDYENVYFRSHKSGTSRSMQYTPVFNGNSAWQLHSGYNYTGRRNYFRKGDWVRIRIAVFDDWLEVYVDDMENIALHVFDLKHPIEAGGLSLWTDEPTWFSNFRIKEVDSYEFYYEKQPKPEPPAEAIQNWKISQTLNPDEANRAWMEGEQKTKLYFQRMSCEYNGLINISRLHKLNGSDNAVIARATISTDSAQSKRMQFGFSDEVKVVLNGKVIFEGQNYLSSRDEDFLGTIGFHQALMLDLKEGDNQLDFLVRENFGGWGLMARFDNLEGIQIAD